MTKSELIQQIRFGIEQLKATNSTLSFEHICRFFARARIAHNVIPATGPVQSYGDQGRDFETFHSYLTKSDINTTCSVGFASKPIAFPCSLEKNPLKKKGKIDSDITTIMASGTTVERIYFFSGEDISVGSRHKKQDEVRTAYGVELEIIDAQALCEHLSDPDLFWIATQYLNIPSDFFPKNEDENWYQILKKDYKERDTSCTYEEFNDIKRAVRFIYKDALLKVDLPFWLLKVDNYINNTVVPRDLQRKAIYEKYIAKLMGQNNTELLEEIIRDYFSDISEYNSPASLDDAQILWTFVRNSKMVIGSTFSYQEIMSFEKRLNEVLELQLKGNISGSSRCSYMETQANLILSKYDGQGEIILNVTDYVNKLEQILPKLQNAPFFPLERLANRVLDKLEIILELGGETHKIEGFIKKLEVHLGKRKSELSIGEGIRDRALIYMKSGKVIMAISLLHQLKIKWFANETTRGVILTAMLLADCYSRLEMHYASKYYNLIAADMSITYGNESNVIDLFPRAIENAAEAAYNSGSWLHFLDLMCLSLGSNHLIEKDFNLYKESLYSKSIYYCALIKLICNKFDMSVSNLIDKKLEKWSYAKNIIDDAYEQLKDKKELFTIEKIEQSLSRDLEGQPLNDIGKNRVIVFNIYGSNWSIKFENSYELNMIAEQFVSMLQIFLVELAGSELFLIKTEVFINLTIAVDSKPDYEQLPSNESSIWNIKIPINKVSDKKEGINRGQLNYVAIIATILRGISLLPDIDMKSLISKKLSEGLLNSVTFGQTYGDLYKTYFEEHEFQEFSRQEYSNSQLLRHFTLKGNIELPWNGSISPTYSRDKNMEIIHKRVNFKESFSQTFEKMINTKEFIKIIHELRAEWLDWQIYLAFGNLIIRYKLNKSGITEQITNSIDYRESFMKFSQKPEIDWYIEIPIDVFSREEMEKYLNNMGIITLLGAYGLEFHSLTPQCKAIKELLISRFNFMEDGKGIMVF